MTAHDREAAYKWHSAMPGRKQQGLSGESLERAVMSIAHMHPDLVEVG